MKTIEVNCETNEQTERKTTDAELAIIESNSSAELARKQAETEIATAKTALLAKLGITADEAKLLLGGN